MDDGLTMAKESFASILAPLAPNTLVGEYSIVRRISEGGFGVVYLAHDKLGQQVAIKEYLPAALARREPGKLMPQVLPEKLSLYLLGLKNFFEEGRSLAQISHPAVVSVLNFFRQNETVYLVMNYLQGRTLQDYIIAGRKLNVKPVFSESTIRSVLIEILQGLQVVHESQMLHLDIKPANIFVTDDNKAVLIDFGATRDLMSQDAQSKQPMYTPGFAAPEMYRRDAKLGAWSDIYAIGACLYSMAIGRPPLEPTKRRQKDILSEKLAEANSEHIFSDKLIEIIEWSMSLNPYERPQTARELRRALIEYH